MTEHLRYDAVLFDVGGTLIGFSDPAPFREFLEEAGEPAGEEAGLELHRHFLEVIRAERDRAVGLGADYAGIAAFWEEIFRRVWPERPDLAAAMYRAFREDRFDRLLPDALPALEALRALGLRLAVVSNFVASLGALLERLGVRSYFEFVIASAQVGLAKPDPRIFDLAVERLGVPCERLLYVGDHVGDDIVGATRAGIDAVLVDRGFRGRGDPCPRIQSLEELPRYVACPGRPARAVLFDLDGVVLDSMPAHLLSWQETLAPLGIALRAADLYPLEGMPTEATAQLLMRRFLGRSCSVEEASRLAEQKRARFRELFHGAAVPGIVQLLHDLRGRGYRLALVTGSARRSAEEGLRRVGVDELFHATVTADDVTIGKPHPEPYRTAARGLGAAPADCLVVENSPLGLRSARAAGMACVALETTLPAAELAGAERVFPDVAALAEWMLGEWRG